MPPKTILKKTMEELKELDIELMDYRLGILCPYCFEVHNHDSVAVPISEHSYMYGCHECGLIVSLQ